MTLVWLWSQLSTIFFSSKITVLTVLRDKFLITVSGYSVKAGRKEVPTCTNRTRKSREVLVFGKKPEKNTDLDFYKFYV